MMHFGEYAFHKASFSFDSHNAMPLLAYSAYFEHKIKMVNRESCDFQTYTSHMTDTEPMYTLEYHPHPLVMVHHVFAVFLGGDVHSVTNRDFLFLFYEVRIG